MDSEGDGTVFVNDITGLEDSDSKNTTFLETEILLVEGSYTLCPGPSRLGPTYLSDQVLGSILVRWDVITTSTLQSKTLRWLTSMGWWFHSMKGEDLSSLLEVAPCRHKLAK